jgi:hypothetical protein
MRYLLPLAFCAAFLVCCELVGRHEVKMRVVDETGVPVVGAAVEVLFVNHNGSDVKKGTTGRGGEYAASGSGNNSIMLRAEKAGHYPAQIDGLSPDRDHDVEVVMPRIVNPISLYVWSASSSGSSAIFPIHNEWVGFDFEAADWVAPHGKGRTADFLMRFRNEFKGLRPSDRTLEERIQAHKRLLAFDKEEWTEDKFRILAGEWDGFMEISFPNSGDGMLEEKHFVQYHAVSPMRVPHLAPEEGYQSSPRRYEVRHGRPTRENKTMFFFRTRVKRDLQGRIVSANYARIVGDFEIYAPSGAVSFTYYFNPTPNDRNLEYHPMKNLFPEDKPGSRFYFPFIPPPK